MSFNATLTLKDAADANVTFVKLDSDATKSVYTLESSTVQEPVLLQIAKTMSQSRDGSNRHLAKVTKVVVDAENRPATSVMNFSFAVPKIGFTQAYVNDMLAYLKSFLTPENVAKMSRGEL